jgi:hypothetical protein
VGQGKDAGDERRGAGRGHAGASAGVRVQCGGRCGVTAPGASVCAHGTRGAGQGEARRGVAFVHAGTRAGAWPG